MEEQLKTQIYQDYYLKVRNYILSKINDFPMAEDLCSDVFVKVYEKYDLFDENKSSLSTWIFTITRNTLIDYYRKREVHLELQDNIALEDENDDICTEDNLKQLASALETLNERERKLIVLYYYKDLTLKEIGKQFGISYAYVKILHKKALIKLKNNIEL